MFKKTTSGLILTILLVGILAMDVDLQEISGDNQANRDSLSIKLQQSSELRLGLRANEEARVTGHRITPTELQKLKQEFGVWQEDHNYNQLIYGHGTGLRPPTEDEWVAVINNSFMVENVLVDSAVQATSSVDLTTTPWFPPIGNQGSQGSCTAWAVGYYTKTFQEAIEHNWALSGAPSDKITSPSFIYNLINNGVDGGSWYHDAVQLVCSVGACSLARMPYDPGDYTSWPSEQAWSEAMLYRGAESGMSYLDLQSDAGLANLKSWLASGNLAVFGVDAYKIVDPFWGWSRLDGNDMLTLDNYVDPIPNHACTIVGYNDNFAYTEQGQTHYGAFKIANSWGIPLLPSPFGWEHICDGCYWISYEAMKQRVNYCMFYNDRIDYQPELIATFQMSHAKRDECYITVGMGNVSNPIVTKSFSQYISGGFLPFCSNRILFDITEFRSVIDIDSQQCHLGVVDYGSSTTGTLLYFAINNGVSSAPPMATMHYQEIFANLTLHLRLNVPDDFPTIQEAINAAYVRGNILSVAPGTYYENVVVNKTVSLIGENRSSTFIDANEIGTAITVVGPSNSTIKEFTIRNASTDIYLSSSSHNTIFDNIMTNGIMLIDSDHNIISGNIITDGSIRLSSFEDGCSYNTIARNTISQGSVRLYESSNNNAIFGNNLTSIFLYVASNNTISDNNITAGSVIIARSWHNTISGNTMTGDIELGDGAGRNTISNNFINGSSIILGWANDPEANGNTITGNIIANCSGPGINLVCTLSNNISENIITNNGYGIYFDSAEFHWNLDNMISGNSITNNDYGIYLKSLVYYLPVPGIYRYWCSSGNTILENDVSNNTFHGVRLDDWSDNNTISENNIESNDVGIYLGNVSNNIVYHNNFIDNTVQVYTDGPANIWDDGYPSGGNWWVDYADVDICSGPYQNETGNDAVWDHSYPLDADNVDHYPLAIPWTPNLEWDIVLTTSEEEYSSTCRLGVRIGSTTGFDETFDAVAPPEQPVCVDSYFWYPNNPSFPNLRRLSTSIIPPSGNMTWIYKVKSVGMGGTMSINWTAEALAQISPDYSLLLLDPGGAVTDMRTLSQYSFTAEADTTYTFTISVFVGRNFSLHLNAGWNLVSFPVIPSNASFSSIFNDVGYYQAVAWDGTSYITPATAETGEAYWILVLTETTLNITSTPVWSYERDLPAGWSLIGSIYNYTANATLVFPSYHQLATWDGTTYIDATIIEPGKGYWALVLTPTHIIVDESRRVE